MPLRGFSIIDLAAIRADVVARFHQGERASALAEEVGVHRMAVYQWAAAAREKYTYIPPKAVVQVPRYAKRKCATCGHSFMSEDDFRDHLVPVSDGRVKLVYVSPELPAVVDCRLYWIRSEESGDGRYRAVPLRTRCSTEGEMTASGYEWYGGILGKPYNRSIAK